VPMPVPVPDLLINENQILVMPPKNWTGE